MLDTNTCIEYLNARSSRVAERMRECEPRDICLCSVVKGELLYGAWHSDRAQHNLALLKELFACFRSLPFDDAAAEVYGRQRAALARKGALIGPNDLLIASIALSNGLAVVTHNVHEFGRVDGLEVEDWQGSR